MKIGLPLPPGFGIVPLPPLRACRALRRDVADSHLSLEKMWVGGCRVRVRGWVRACVWGLAVAPSACVCLCECL